ncbi:unnamed protein product [Cyprideis torosa]|uniref:Uncharacterized protein n=1 Tax=Cyprideis torosa TaxID=163714 RepID=A0A7R8W2I8_9CRUS|nr:unnamed protein product [Cyprideis torosa]CAG0879809.1 unnamed protein product [Cyprideis torosa]
MEPLRRRVLFWVCVSTVAVVLLGTSGLRVVDARPFGYELEDRKKINLDNQPFSFSFNVRPIADMILQRWIQLRRMGF